VQIDTILVPMQGSKSRLTDGRPPLFVPEDDAGSQTQTDKLDRVLISDDSACGTFGQGKSFRSRQTADRSKSNAELTIEAVDGTGRSDRREALPQHRLEKGVSIGRVQACRI
jgi:hypothetical protein